MPSSDTSHGKGHALVTGASSGIGLAIAAALLENGWQVTGVARRPVPLSHPALRSLPIDLATEDAAAAVCAAVSGVTALVHAAGFLRTNTLEAVRPTDLAAMWQMHVALAEGLAAGLVPRMTSGGRVVLIGSRTSAGSAGRSQYAATKAAMVGLARSWAIELAPQGITVNVVAPGATETPMLNDPARKGVAPKLPPIGRFVQPAEVAALTAFLLSPAAAAITGQQIMVCGGASL